MQYTYMFADTKAQDLVLLSVANAPIRNDASLAAVDPSVIGVIAHSRKNVKKVRPVCFLAPCCALLTLSFA